MPDPIGVTLVVVTHRRSALVRRCLDSLPAPDGRFETLLVVNGAGGGEQSLLAEAPGRWPGVRILAIARTGRGAARNLAAASARGEFVHFLDDDTIAPPGFVDRLIAALARHPSAPCLGGPNLGAPGARPFQRAVDFLLRSPLGAGPLRVRYEPLGAERPMPGWGLMLCNLGVRREVFERHGLRFPSYCASAEENLLLSRVERLLGRGAYCPDLAVFHERRPSVRSFAAQVYASGLGRVQITRLDPRSLQPVTLLPPAFAVYAAAAPWLGARAALPLLAYAAACLVEAARLALSGDHAGALRLPLLFPLAHACYAAGMARGLIDAALGQPADPVLERAPA